MIDNPEQPRTWRERIEALLARLQALAASAAAAISDLKNRVQTQTLVGTVIAPAGLITPVATLTTVSSSGKFRISASMTATLAGPAVFTPFLSVGINAGPQVIQYAWAQEVVGPAATAIFDDSVVFEFDAGIVVAPGAQIHVQWQSSGGDGPIIVGGGGLAGQPAANLLVEELP